MIEAFKTKFEEYSTVLNKWSIPFEEETLWLLHGRSIFNNNWILFMSMRPNQAIEVLDTVLPILKKEAVSFKLIKNQQLNFQLNDGMVFQEEKDHNIAIDVAKALTIYTTSEEQAIRLVGIISNCTGRFQGPDVPDAVKIGKILYASYCKVNPANSNFQMILPSKGRIPFKIRSEEVTRIKSKSRIIGKYYIPYETIKSVQKGIVYKAINIKKLSLTWCLIKIGREFTFDDTYNRDIQDRLLWQKNVLKDLEGHVPIGKVLDLISDKHSTTLVTEFLEGTPLGVKVEHLRAGKQWDVIDPEVKLNLLSYFLKIIRFLEIMHDRGYIHRDVTSSNFIVLKNEEIGGIDFELSYSLNKNQPDPPFLLGTYGYMSPQQSRLDQPTIYDDIYSLGALLMQFITGREPDSFLHEFKNEAMSKMEEIANNKILSNLIQKCLKDEIEQRPVSLEEIRSEINNYIGALSNNTMQGKLSLNSVTFQL